jgi:hypothetical protein
VLSQTESNLASLGWCLAGLGSVAALDEAPERAARLWGAARAQLGESAFAAWAAGQARTLEQAIAYALEMGAMKIAETVSRASSVQ